MTFILSGGLGEPLGLVKLLVSDTLCGVSFLASPFNGVSCLFSEIYPEIAYGTVFHIIGRQVCIMPVLPEMQCTFGRLYSYPL